MTALRRKVEKVVALKILWHEYNAPNEVSLLLRSLVGATKNFKLCDNGARGKEGGKLAQDCSDACFMKDKV